MSLRFRPLEAELVAAVRAGAADANGQPAERGISDGAHTPCRSCLRDVPAGHAMLILAARPFRTLTPYAETGPVFLCAEACTPWTSDGVPPVLRASPDYLVKGYSRAERIVSGTGQVTPEGDVPSYVEALLDREDVSFVDVRSARNNCWLARAVRVS